MGTETQEGASASVWVRGGQVGESRWPVAGPVALSPGDAVPESHGPTARGPTQSPEGLHGGNRAPSQGHTATWLRRSLRDKAKAWPETQSCRYTAQPSRSAQPWGLLKVLAAFCRRQDGVPAACRALGQAAPRASASTFFFWQMPNAPMGSEAPSAMGHRGEGGDGGHIVAEAGMVTSCHGDLVPRCQRSRGRCPRPP